MGLIVKLVALEICYIILAHRLNLTFCLMIILILLNWVIHQVRNMLKEEADGMYLHVTEVSDNILIFILNYGFVSVLPNQCLFC